MAAEVLLCFQMTKVHEQNSAEEDSDIVNTCGSLSNDTAVCIAGQRSLTPAAAKYGTPL